MVLYVARTSGARPNLSEPTPQSVRAHPKAWHPPTDARISMRGGTAGLQGVH